MKIAVGPNAHGMEVYERLVIDPKGNLVRLPWDAKLKPGWTEATQEDLAVAERVQKERAERERAHVEQTLADKKTNAAPPEGGPIVRARQNLDDPLVGADGRQVPGNDLGAAQGVVASQPPQGGQVADRGVITSSSLDTSSDTHASGSKKK